MYRHFFKRIIDFAASLILIVFLLPVIVVTTFLLSIANKGNPFFTQRRPGKNGKIFRIVKFKTMNDKRDIHGKLLPDKLRLTKIGKTIRKTSIDELPQLFNVLLGDMSLVGPRPLLVDYLPLYNQFQARRHEAKPGITGWTQVNGRNSLSWEEKFKLDVWYIDHINFLLDLKILLLTVLKVLKREGINEPGQVTMQRFTGNN